MSSGITGQEDISYSKQDLAESKELAFGTRAIVFAHKATAGDTGINLQALVTPTELSSNGFTNPSSSDIAAARLFFYRKNLKLYSSVRGRLHDYDAYTLGGSTQINFIGSILSGGGALDGEIFTGYLELAPSSGIIVADGKAYRKTYLLPNGSTTVNLGNIYKVGVGLITSDQVGSILVFRNGLQQFRNVANATAAPLADGNYQEIDNGTGYGSTIEFNIAASDPAGDAIEVEFGFQIFSGDLNIFAAIEQINGILNAVAPDLALVTGNPVSNYLTANPADVDRRTFGDQVLDHETRIEALETATIRDEAWIGGGNGAGSTNTNVYKFTTVLANTGTPVINQSATLGDSITIQTAGLYAVTGVGVISNTTGLSITKNSTAIQNLGDPGYLSYLGSDTTSLRATAVYMGPLVVGDVIRLAGNTPTSATENNLHVVRIGN